MDHRVKKRIIILTGFVLIAGLFGFLIYFIVHNPANCFDNIQNQDEAGVDCGGACEKQCELKPEDIKVIFTKVIPTLPQKYNMILKLSNPNAAYGVKSADYVIKFFNESQLIADYNGSFYILPNDTKTVVLNALDMELEPDNVSVAIENIDWIKLQNYQTAPQIVVKNQFYHKLVNQTAFSEIKGVAVNRSDFDFDKIDVNILLFDSNKEIIDGTFTEVRTLFSGEEREFIANWFYPIQNPASVEIEADTNVFESDNFMKRYGSPEKFQEL